MTTIRKTSLQYCGGAFIVLLLALAVYQKALWFTPADDDLRILSSVSQINNPLSYFVSDWGMAGTYRMADGRVDKSRRTYRPLHSISIWMVYKLFGVSAYPNQLINLFVHVVNVLLLLEILRKLKLNVILSIIIVVLGLVSLFTASPVTWVSDRPTLFVALCVLLFINYIVMAQGDLRVTVNPWLIAGLSIAAFLFQEGGLIVPLTAGVFVAVFPYHGPRWRHVTVCIVLVGSYFGLRLLLFGSGAFAYTSEGFIFGNHFYVSMSDLSFQAALWARFENFTKNCLCVFVPIIEWTGRVDSLSELTRSAVWWLPTLTLTILATRRPIAKLQWLALAVIVINAGLHLQVFRYRVDYISQLAFCLYVASSPIWRHNLRSLCGVGRSQLAAACCGLVALVSISQVNQNVQATWVERENEMTVQRLSTLTRTYPISEQIIAAVLAKYAPVTGKSPGNGQ